MDHPNTLAEAIAALDLARVDAQALENLNAEHLATVAVLTETKASLASTVLAFEKLQADHSELLAKTLALEADASAKANAIIANLGVEPVAILAAEIQPKTQQELWAEYNALPIGARNDFYAKHRDILRS